MAVQERSVATRAALLDAAIECLVDLGYAATTTIETARRAGVSRGRAAPPLPDQGRAPGHRRRASLRPPPRRVRRGVRRGRPAPPTGSTPRWTCCGRCSRGRRSWRGRSCGWRREPIPSSQRRCSRSSAASPQQTTDDVQRRSFPPQPRRRRARSRTSRATSRSRSCRASRSSGCSRTASGPATDYVDALKALFRPGPLMQVSAAAARHRRGASCRHRFRCARNPRA